MHRMKKRLIFISCVMVLVLALTPITGYSKVKKAPVTLTFYSQTTEYLGMQEGWFAKVLLDKYNVKIKIINEVKTPSKYGDICIFGKDKASYLQAIKMGALLDWNQNDILSDYAPYISKNMSAALEWNKEMTKSGKVYGIGGDITLSEKDHQPFFFHPDIRWDLYKQLGYPEVNTLEDWIDVLAQMKKICPTSDSGKETYGVSLFNDWDSDSVMFVRLTAALYGYEAFGIGLYNVNTQTWQGNLDNGSMYLRCLKFYNQLYQKDLLDPESLTQGYEGGYADYADGAAFFSIIDFIGSSYYNTLEHIKQGKAMYPLASEDQSTLCYGLATNNSSSIWAIGSKTKYPDICMKIINWLYTPEGTMTVAYGPKGVTWDYNSKKQPYLTDLGLECLKNGNTEMANGYTGIFIDGRSMMNGQTWSIDATNPDSDGETYNYNYWSTYCSNEKSDILDDWRKFTGKINVDQYLNSKKHSVALATSYSMESINDSLDMKWDKVTSIINDYSWKAIYAETDDEFSDIVKEMQEKADDKGYAVCCKFMQVQAAERKVEEDKVRSR